MFTKQRVTEPHSDGPGPNLVITDDWTLDQDKTLGYTWIGITAPDPDMNDNEPSFVLPPPSSLPEPAETPHTTT